MQTLLLWITFGGKRTDEVIDQFEHAFGSLKQSLSRVSTDMGRDYDKANDMLKTGLERLRKGTEMVRAWLGSRSN